MIEGLHFDFTATEIREHAHAKKAKEFQILAGHIVGSEVYRLNDGDLRKLEMYTGY